MKTNRHIPPAISNYKIWYCPNCNRQNSKRLRQEFAYCKHCDQRTAVFKGERRW